MQMPTPKGGVMLPAATTMAMPSPWLGVSAVPQALKFNEDREYTGLLFHSPHSILYQDMVYPTAMHLFEAHKFLDHRPDLAERIRRCEHVEGVTETIAELEDFARRDWDWDWENIALNTVSFF